MYADLFSFHFSQTETCTVNVDVHNFFVLKKKRAKDLCKSFDHSIVVLSKKEKKKFKKIVIFFVFLYCLSKKKKMSPALDIFL